jgi:hypothetical protein
MKITLVGESFKKDIGQGICKYNILHTKKFTWEKCINKTLEVYNKVKDEQRRKKL